MVENREVYTNFCGTKQMFYHTPEVGKIFYYNASQGMYPNHTTGSVSAGVETCGQ